MITASTFSNFCKSIFQASEKERIKLYEKLMQTNIAGNNLGIFSTFRYVKYLDTPKSFTIGFESVENRDSFIQIIENAGFKQGIHYVRYGKFKYSVTFEPDFIVRPYDKVGYRYQNVIGIDY